jgi:hypothetical protein
MTKAEALDLAHRHIIHQNTEAPLHPDYEYVVTEPTEYADYWYFDHEFNHKADLPESEWLGFGGAPGYTVSKQTGEVTPISWQEKRALT